MRRARKLRPDKLGLSAYGVDVDKLGRIIFELRIRGAGVQVAKLVSKRDAELARRNALKLAGALLRAIRKAKR